jgi:hypothetical protein
MVTLLNLSVLQHISMIFPFLFVFVLCYAILLKTKVIGEDKGIAAIAAICVAAMTLFVPRVGDLLMTMAPWFMILFIFLAFVFMMFRFAGTPESVFEKFFSEPWSAPQWFMFAAALIIFFVAASQVLGPEVAQATQPGVNATEEDFGTDVIQIIFHPSVLATILILLIASFAIRLLGGEGVKR